MGGIERRTLEDLNLRRGEICKSERQTTGISSHHAGLNDAEGVVAEVPKLHGHVFGIIDILHAVGHEAVDQSQVQFVFQDALAKAVILENDQEGVAVCGAISVLAADARGNELPPGLDPVAEFEIDLLRDSDKSAGGIAEAFTDNEIAFVVYVSDRVHYVSLMLPLPSRRREPAAARRRRGGTTSMQSDL